MPFRRFVSCFAWVGLLAACSAGDGARASIGVGGASQGGAGQGGASAGGASSGGSAGTSTGGTFVVSSGGSGAAGAQSASGGGNANPNCNPPADQATAETCDTLDNDLDGFVDEACVCAVGSQQACFDGPPSQATTSNCHMGTQKCAAFGEFSEWGPCENSGCGALALEETCDNGLDDDCDGQVDEGCYLDAVVNLDGDCLSAYCPPQAPNPVGCQITMEGGDSRGCIAHAPGSAEVYFQEGNACPVCILGICTGGSGRVFGTLRCSSSATSVPLDATNCPINKTDTFYTVPSGSPIIQSNSGCPQ